ncbi:hypothetical protein NC653_026421 [Populus alba x Populus x berolinensis]|uniref:Uncharacterized protein n=1 Tax=Populus alba x Populus x berolinensis TaxID=444605 RepID=A0AAD6MEW1_9ROSI|nr:hypothetical protein NC653_026421 [Populus alba x Populus x berolinensis]
MWIMELDERMRDAFHGFIEERGVDEKLFNFLQAWLYVKEHGVLCVGLKQWAHTSMKISQLRVLNIVIRGFVK